DQLSSLSAERIWMELKKLLSAPDPSRALLWMRQTGVLTQVLPETEKWGIDAIHSLVETERAFGWPVEPILRLASIVPPDPQRMEKLATRLRFSKAESAALISWAESPQPDPSLSEGEFRKLLYGSEPRAIDWRLRLGLASARARARESDKALVEAAGYQRLLDITARWERPVFPVRGKDLLDRGYKPGEEVGAKLSKLERNWVDSGFSLSREDLLDNA